MLLVIMILWQSLERFKGLQPQKLPEFKWYWNLKPTWILSGLQQKQTLDVLKTVFNLMLENILLTVVALNQSETEHESENLTKPLTQPSSRSLNELNQFLIYLLKFQFFMFGEFLVIRKTDIATRFRPGYLSRLVD